MDAVAYIYGACNGACNGAFNGAFNGECAAANKAQQHMKK
jgi:hypothetical protein